MNKNIWQLKIQCCDASKKCEVDSTYTLEDLCSFILKSFNFDNDHLHKFYLSRSGRPYGQDVIEISSSSKIHDIFQSGIIKVCFCYLILEMSGYLKSLKL